MGKYFGTDGFRGEANVQLTVDNAFKVGRYVGWYYGRDHKAKIVIGKDTRRSSYMFEYALVAGLTASGADAYLLHVTTTPSVSFAVRTEDFDCGIMISASHNPFYDNGIKAMTLACLVSFATSPASIPIDCVESMVSAQLPRKARSEPRSRTPHKSATTDSVARDTAQ